MSPKKGSNSCIITQINPEDRSKASEMSKRSTIDEHSGLSLRVKMTLKKRFFSQKVTRGKYFSDQENNEFFRKLREKVSYSKGEIFRKS